MPAAPMASNLLPATAFDLPATVRATILSKPSGAARTAIGTNAATAFSAELLAISRLMASSSPLCSLTNAFQSVSL